MTLAYNKGGLSEQGVRNEAELISGYITATALDTTATVNGPAIANLDGAIAFVGYSNSVTDQGGAANLQGTLQGSNDGVGWYALKDTSGTTIQSSNTAIGAATPSAPIALSFETQANKREFFPAYIRVQEVLSANSRTSTSNLFIIRTKRAYAIR